MFSRLPDRSALVSLGLCALFSACNPSGSSDPTMMDSPHEISSPSATYLKSICGNGENCSPSVGLLTIRFQGALTQCMGSLVGDDLLVTTSHCIPEALRAPGASCQGIIQAQFPAVGDFPEAQLDCQTIVGASSLYDRSQAHSDYGFIRLSGSAHRPVLQIDHSGLKHNALYQVIQTTALGSLAKITPRSCRAIQGCEALPGSVHPESSVMTMTDCATDSDSEGAPILDEQGRIHGIIQAPVPATRLLKRINEPRFSEARFAAISWATNFSCVRFPENDGDFVLPGACQEDPNSPNENSVQLRSQMLISKSIEVTNSNYTWPSLSSDIQWSTQAFPSSSKEAALLASQLSTGSDLSIFVIPVPKCIARDSQLSATGFSLPVIGFSSALDHNLVPSLDPGRPLDGVPVRMEIISSRLRLGGLFGSASKSVSIFIERTGKPLVLRAPLPDCSPEPR